jgi:hypothetical protein
MMQSGLRHTDDMIPTGFSIAIYGIGAFASVMKKSMLRC